MSVYKFEESFACLNDPLSLCECRLEERWYAEYLYQYCLFRRRCGTDRGIKASRWYTKLERPCAVEAIA